MGILARQERPVRPEHPAQPGRQGSRVRLFSWRPTATTEIWDRQGRPEPPEQVEVVG